MCNSTLNEYSSLLTTSVVSPFTGTLFSNGTTFGPPSWMSGGPDSTGIVPVAVDTPTVSSTSSYKIKLT